VCEKNDAHPETRTEIGSGRVRRGIKGWRVVQRKKEKIKKGDAFHGPGKIREKTENRGQKKRFQKEKQEWEGKKKKRKE